MHESIQFFLEKKTIKDKSKRRKTITKGCQFHQKKKLREFAENVFVSFNFSFSLHDLKFHHIWFKLILHYTQRKKIADIGNYLIQQRRKENKMG